MKLILLILVSFITLQSCGDNPQIEKQVETIITPVDPGDEPVDPELPTPDDPIDDVSPEPTIKLYKIDARTINEEDEIVLPYSTKHFKAVAPSAAYENNSLKNVQTVFAFDLPEIDFDKETVLDIVIRTDLYTHKKNKGTEILCSLDLRLCSGLAIKENPKLLQLFRKNRNPDFWTGPTDQMSTYEFINLLAHAQEHDKKTYKILDADIQLSKVLGTSTEDLIGLLVQESIYFTIADDTMVVKPTLYIKVSEEQ
ncbi:MAG: hypothetical protein JNM93_08805 [Bacteriovoracaceae bacterium]|nr:hypothetical protein [Bacteriovoracaceae bacterium]